MRMRRGTKAISQPHRMRSRMTGGDVGILLVCIAAVVSLFLPRIWAKEGAEVVITYTDDTQTERYSLSVDRELFLQHGEYALTLTIEDGEVLVCESSCPDHLCERSGAISKQGESIVCAPAGICIMIRGTQEEGEADAIAG